MPAKKAATKSSAKKPSAKTKDLKPKKNPKGGAKNSSAVVSLGKL
jgi:hypothetical protein